MICPKCGFEQPDAMECMRCGVIVSRYKGPVVGAGGARDTPPAFAPAAPLPAAFIPPPPVIAGGTVHAPIPPPPALAGGSVYGGPPPPPAGGGTVYGGPGSVAPAFSSFPSGPAFVGTFEVGKVLGESFSIYFSNLAPFVLLSAIVHLPLFVVASYISSIQHKAPGTALYLFFGALVVQVILAQVAAAGVTYGVYQQMRGNNPSLAECLRMGLARLFPVVGVASLSVLAEIAGFMLCIAPGVLIALRLPVVVPVTVEEKPGVFAAMRRSAYLTEGYRGQVFGVLFLLGIITQILVRVAILPAHDLSTLLMISSAVNVLTTGLLSTALAVMYYRLRSLKESIDVDQISSVFA